MSDFKTPAGPRCRCLRARTMYLPEQDPEPVFGFEAVDPGHYWCKRTLRAIGPDDRLVTPEGCGPGRDCFEPL